MPDLTQRLALYHRLAGATTPAQARELAQEVRDRYGMPPPEAANLLFLIEVRAWAHQGGVQAVVQEEGQLVVRVREGVALPRARLERQVAGFGQVRPNQVRLELKALRGSLRQGGGQAPSTGSGQAWRGVLLATLQTLAGETAVVAATR